MKIKAPFKIERVTPKRLRQYGYEFVIYSYRLGRYAITQLTKRIGTLVTKEELGHF